MYSMLCRFCGNGNISAKVGQRCRDVLLIWKIIGQGSTVVVVGPDGWEGGVWTSFLSSIILIFFLPFFGRGSDID